MAGKLKMKQMIHFNPKSDDKMAIITREAKEEKKTFPRVKHSNCKKKSETTTKRHEPF